LGTAIVAAERLPDEEIVYRRILKKDTKNNRIPNQFKLRQGESGISVNRAKLISKTEVLAKGDKSFEYLLAQAMIGAIRELTADDGAPLHLDVVPTDTEADPSHAEIQGPITGQLPDGASQALRREFQKDFPVPIDDFGPA
jgi:hypothetical protein